MGSEMCIRDRSRRPDVRTSGRRDVWTSGRRDVWTSGRPDVRTSGRPDVRPSRRRDVRTSKNNFPKTFSLFTKIPYLIPQPHMDMSESRMVHQASGIAFFLYFLSPILDNRERFCFPLIFDRTDINIWRCAVCYCPSNLTGR